MAVIIGLTGSLGTGKSTALKYFKDFGAKVLSADDIVHGLLRKNSVCYGRIRKAFGDGIILKGSIDRKKLGEIVFNEPKKLKKLEGIIHPVVKKEIFSKIKDFKKGRKNFIVVFEVPLLFEAGLDKNVDYVVVVASTLSQQIERAVKKLNITKSEAARRIKCQMPLKEKIRYADIIIDNRKNKTQLKLKVKQICEKISKRIKK